MPSQQLTFRPNKKNHSLLYKPFDKSVGVNTSHKSQQLCRWLNHKPAARRGPGTLHVATVTASLGLHCAVRTALVCCESKNTRETTATLFRWVIRHLATAARGSDVRWSVGDLSSTAQLI